MKSAQAKKRILVIDDEPELRMIIEMILNHSQFESIVATDAKHAQELIGRGNVDLVLCDAHMPDMHGIDFLRWLRERYDTPFILMSGAVRGDEIAKAESLRLSGVLGKPFLRTDLLAQVSACLKEPVPSLAG